MTFVEKIMKRQRAVNSSACVGLDTDREFVALKLGLLEEPVWIFNKAIINETNPFVCAYKINFSFYAISGWLESVLIDTIEYIHKKHPGIPVILDAKIGDIGHASEKYARMVFERFKADAVTASPYLGQDALQPFLDRADKGVIVLCRTSNQGAREFQDLPVTIDKGLVPGIDCLTLPLYQHVAYRVANEWNKNNNCLLVVGATYPEELGEVRQIVGDLPILVPGIGAQGGDLEGVIRNGLDSTGSGLIISSSREIIYASKKEDFAKKAGRGAKKLRDEINRLKEELIG